MPSPNQLEDAYKEFSENLTQWVPDGILSVDLQLMQELGLLNYTQLEQPTDHFTHYFHVIESDEKVTLYNDQFAIWIVPKLIENTPTTLTFISLLIPNKKPHLEIVFSTAGVYNTPKHILKILQHFLTEVIDTEAIIAAIDKKAQ